ncbi:MAG: hypothetical protein JF585_11020, partial [Burkholderiales bacterium]|nr:hypothetical protein [Burkholderiales bacterium]
STAARGWAEFLLRDAPSNLSATALALAAKVIEKETMQFTIATAQLYAKATEEQRRTWKPVFAAESRDLKILSDSATPGRRPAASGMDGVLALIGATSDPDDLKDYGSDLAKAVSRAPIVQSEAIFARLLQLRNSTFDSDQRAALLQGMLAAVDRFPPHSRMAQFQNGCCAWAAQFRSDPEAVQSLVGRLVSGMDSTEAYELGHRTIEVLGKSEAISPKNDAYGDTKSLVQGPIVVAVSGRVSADPALLQKWTTELESLQAKKPPRGVSDLVMQALAVTASSQPNDDDQLSKLFDILLEGAERAPLQTVDRTWRANRQALLSRVSSGDDEDRNVDCNASSPPQPPISVGLCVIAARLSDRTAMDWLQKLTKRHIESPTVKRRILVALIVNRRLEVLVSMQGTLLESMIHDTRRPELRTTKAAYMIISERQDVAIRSRFTMDVARGLLLLKAGDGAQARVLSEMLSGMIVARKAVSDSITPDAALAGLLVEACKLPYVDRVKVAAAIRRGDPACRDPRREWHSPGSVALAHQRSLARF